MSLPAADHSVKPDLRTTLQLGAVLPRTAEVRGDHLYLGGVDLVQLAHNESTALWVFDEAELTGRMDEYLRAFRSRYANSDVLYASKSFMCKEVLRLARAHGLCLDVSGGGEFACAQAVDFPADRIYLHGNNKTPAELREAIAGGIGRIVIDSRIELHRISAIAGELGRVQDILVRVTPGVEADTHAYVRTGCEDSKFGFTMKDDFAFRALADVIAEPNVRLVGLHCHIGSQIFQLSSFAEAARIMVELFGRVQREYGIALHELDLGGGLGIAYEADDNPPSIDDFARITTQAVLDACAEYGVEPPHLLVEPGRSLVANAGVTLYTVGILKTLPGIRKYVAVDGGISDNIRCALYHAAYEPVIANKAAQPRTEVITVAGKHCESGDVVVLDKPLQHPDLGDVLCVFGTGAYCTTMASNYNGQPRPAVVFVKDGCARTVVRRETYADIWARDL